jgi:hypothetical protein
VLRSVRAPLNQYVRRSEHWLRQLSGKQEPGIVSAKDLRPAVWIGHVVLETDRLEETESFMRKIGMRPIVETRDVAVLELRGGTHLVLVATPKVTAGEAPFDLMVEDLHATY